MANDRPVQGGAALPVAITGESFPSTGDGMPVEQAVYTNPQTGEVAGSGSAKQLPTISCKLAKIKARSDNAGSVFLGTSSSVSKPNGNDDTTTGFELDAGDETGWIPVDNLNRFYIICDNAGDDLTYMTQG